MNRVLVLCQVKKSPQRDMIEGPGGIIDALLGTTDATVTYLSECAGPNKGDVDFRGCYGCVNDEFTEDFQSGILKVPHDNPDSRKEYYSLIVLNTCPFHLMNFKAIHYLLKKDGKIALTAYPSSKPLKMYNKLPLDRYFTLDETTKDRNGTGVLVYRKINVIKAELHDVVGSHIDILRQGSEDRLQPYQTLSTLIIEGDIPELTPVLDLVARYVKDPEQHGAVLANTMRIMNRQLSVMDFRSQFSKRYGYQQAIDMIKELRDMGGLQS